MTFGHGFWIITGVYFLACMSPGPDFVLVSQQVLSRGRAAGMLTALGIALGFGIHIGAVGRRLAEGIRQVAAGGHGSGAGP